VNLGVQNCDFPHHPLYVIILIVHDWSQQSEIRPYAGQSPPFCCWAAHPQLSKAVFFTEWRQLLLCIMDWDSCSIISVSNASIKCLWEWQRRTVKLWNVQQLQVALTFFFSKYLVHF